MITPKADSIDTLFGPMDPEAEDLAMFLKGYPVTEPEAAKVLYTLSDEDRSIILGFADSNPHPVSIQEYLDGLIVGYHKADPNRRSESAKKLVQEEIQKAERYVELYTTLHIFPKLELRQNEFNEEGGELTWVSAGPLSIRLWGAAQIEDGFMQIRAALADPEYCEFRYRNVPTEE